MKQNEENERERDGMKRAKEKTNRKRTEGETNRKRANGKTIRRETVEADGAYREAPTGLIACRGSPCSPRIAPMNLPSPSRCVA